jgi:Cys-rich repeat protein
MIHIFSRLLLVVILCADFLQAHAKPPVQCQSDSDCKKGELCLASEGLGRYCAEYSKKCEGYRWGKHAPDEIKGKCVPPPLPPGAVPYDVRDVKP